jgi:hypothetical protein
MENQEQAQMETPAVEPQQMEQTQSAEQTQPAAQPAPELTLNDLANLKAIVETAARRGAFQATEMTAVGAVFDRLSTFLTAVTPKPPADTPAA